MNLSEFIDQPPRLALAFRLYDRWREERDPAFLEGAFRFSAPAVGIAVRGAGIGDYDIEQEVAQRLTIQLWRRLHDQLFPQRSPFAFVKHLEVTFGRGAKALARQLGSRQIWDFDWARVQPPMASLGRPDGGLVELYWVQLSRVVVKRVPQQLRDVSEVERQVCSAVVRMLVKGRTLSPQDLHQRGVPPGRARFLLDQVSVRLRILLLELEGREL